MDSRMGDAVRALFVGLVILVLLLGSALAVVAVAAAQAERPEGLPELTLAPCPELAGIAAGPDGVLFPRATADCMLARLRGLEALLPYVASLERDREGQRYRASLFDRELALATRDADLAGEQVEAATEAAAASQRVAASLEAELNAWYRHPVLLVGLGVVLTIALEVAAIFALREVSP